jgi:hypothetical protein
LLRQWIEPPAIPPVPPPQLEILPSLADTDTLGLTPGLTPRVGPASVKELLALLLTQQLSSRFNHL